jgi:hypothetical protein
MKKIILSLAFIAIMGLLSKNAEAGRIRGHVDKIGGDGFGDIVFTCSGISGTCCEGDIYIGGHITITGFPGDWEIIGYSTGGPLGDEISAEISN